MMLNKTFYLLLLSLIPLLGFSQANSQYPDSGNKIRLGFQTTGDGLIWRDTQPKVGGYQPINNKAAWIILDTINNKFYHYKNSTWTLAGGQDIDTANLIATKYDLGFKLSLADTQNMLTPYWRSGRFSGVLPVANGGTNASTLAANKVMVGNGTSGVLTPTRLHWDNTHNRLGIGFSAVPSAVPQYRLHIAGPMGQDFLNYTENDSIPNTRFGIRLENSYAKLLFNSYNTPLYLSSFLAGGTGGVVAIETGTRYGETTERMRVDTIGRVGIGTTSPTARLHVKGSGVDGNTTALKVDNNGNVNLLTILDNGFVGIGTTTPSTSLQINKNATSRASGGLVIKTNNSNESLLSVGVSTSLGSAFISSLQNGTGDALPIDFITGNSSTNVRMRITSTGNIGIGESTPTEKLHVVGNGLFTGSVTATKFNVTDSIQANSGVYKVNATTLGLNIDNTTPFRITTGGNWGVYNDNPQNLLSLFSTSARGGVISNQYPILMFNETGGSQFIFGLDANEGYLWGKANVKLRIATNAVERMRIETDGEVRIGYGANDNGAYLLQINGTPQATGALVVISDEKFKENITPLNKGLEIVNKLKPVTYNFISDTKNNFSEYEEVGFIAQDVDRALSTETFAKSIVNSADDSEPTSTMGLATQNLIPILVKAIQEQQSLIKALEQRILNLENK